MLNKEDKIEFLNNMISNMDIHIEVLEEDIFAEPNADVEGKPTRQSILNDMYNKKTALQQELSAIQAG